VRSEKNYPKLCLPKKKSIGGVDVWREKGYLQHLSRATKRAKREIPIPNQMFQVFGGRGRKAAQ